MAETSFKQLEAEIEQLKLEIDSCGQSKLCARGHWRPAEDSKLKELVALYGPQNWNQIRAVGCDGSTSWIQR